MSVGRAARAASPPKPVLVQASDLGLVLAGYTDGQMFYFADPEFADIAAATEQGGPRLRQRRAGRWHIEHGLIEAPPTALMAVSITGVRHFSTRPKWSCPLTVVHVGGTSAVRSR